MCECSDNPAIVFGSVARKARKPHRCAECGRPIARGEAYREYSGLWDEGGWQTYRWCAHCEAARALIDRDIRDFCFCFTGLWEAADELRSDSRKVSVAYLRLVVGARRQWTARRGPRAGRLVPPPDAARRLAATAPTTGSAVAMAAG